MARQIWLLRHADAEPHGERDDAARPLTARGEEQARAAGIALARIGASFELVLYSPKVRAVRTAAIALAEVGQADVARPSEALAGGPDAAFVADAVAGLGPDAHVLIVGHEPYLTTLIAELTGARADLKKGGLAVVRLGGGGGELAALLRPRELAAIAGAAVAA
ncbi:MAG TPA: histidine phosphatase family protein [Solirubrobacteraceae bacterium]|nr:histidine phosphatase family protein [Solirubrobacteraceae bacterium]